MKKTLVPVAVLALSLLTAPVAFAQEEPADCGAATVALQTAKTDHDKAAAADDKLAKAEDRRETRDDARSARNDARNKLSNDPFGTDVAVPGDVAQAKEKRNALRAALNDDSPETPAGHSVAEVDREIERLDRYIKAENDLDDAQKKVDRNQSVADARKDADKTDADALKKVLDDAQDDVNRLCSGVTTTPTPTPEPAPIVDLDCADFPLADGRTAQQVLDSTPGEDPNGLDADLDRRACEPGQDTAFDGSDIADTDEPVVVPEGGVATGGGPAWAFQ